MALLDDGPTTITFRPRAHLFEHLITAAGVLSVPVFIALYWVTVPTGGWVWVLGAQVVIVAVLVTAVVLRRDIYVRLHDWGIEDHWPLGFTRRVRPGDVDTILLLDFYVIGSTETRAQLFAVDAKDRLRLRMRGQVWSRTAIQQVAARLGAPVVHASAPMTLAEFTRIEPKLLAWFERRPIWRVRPADRGAVPAR